MHFNINRGLFRNSPFLPQIALSATVQFPHFTAPPPAASAPGPGSPIDVAFSFDTTGSMYACLGEVRRKVQVSEQSWKGNVLVDLVNFFCIGTSRIQIDQLSSLVSFSFMQSRPDITRTLLHFFARVPPKSFPQKIRLKMIFIYSFCRTLLLACSATSPAFALRWRRRGTTATKESTDTSRSESYSQIIELNKC